MTTTRTDLSRFIASLATIRDRWQALESHSIPVPAAEQDDPVPRYVPITPDQCRGVIQGLTELGAVIQRAATSVAASSVSTTAGPWHGVAELAEHGAQLAAAGRIALQQRRPAPNPEA